MPLDHPNRPHTWDDIRHAFEHSDETVAVIARRFDVTAQQVRYRARKLKWTPRPSGAAALAIANAKRSAGLTRPSYAVPLAAPEHKAKHDCGTRRDSGSLTHCQAIITRLYDVIDAKLAEIERRIASDRTIDSAEAERESREIGTLIKNFEKLTELSDAHDVRTTRRADGGGAAHDAEQLRQDLVRRLERIRAANRDRPVAGKDEPEGPRSPEP
jgi:hypothetical protein